MLIQFNKIRWKNLLSYGNYWTEIDLSQYNSTLIVGKNGDGKSTLLDAFNFVLFNKPYRKVNKSLLVNSIIKKNTLVEIEFTRSGHSWMVRRGIKPNVFEIYRDDELINQDSNSKDYQEELENIIGINPKSVPHVVVLGSANYTPFMQLPAAARRQVIEDLLDIQIFSVMNDLLKTRILTNKEALKEADYAWRNASNALEMAKEHNKNIKTNNDAIIKNKEKEIEEYSDEALKVLSDIKSLNKKLKKIGDPIDTSSLMKDIREKEKEQGSIAKEITLLKRTVSFLDDHNECPTCKQNIDKHFKSNHIEENEKQIGVLSTRTVYLDEQIEKISEQIKKAESVSDDRRKLEREINQKQNIVDSNTKFVKRLMKEIEELQEIEEAIPTGELEKKEKETTKIVNELSKERDLLSVTSSLLKDDGVKAVIINKYVPVINELINKFLSVMDLFVDFHINEQFEETILSRHRDDFVYESFSEGQKLRIDLAILFTWRVIANMRNTASTNLLIFDEILDSSLDDEGIDSFIQIIKNLTEKENVVVISHRDAVADKFDNRIKFKRIQNFSHMDTENA
mgnify:CR=1 FL=1